ncbi:MAG: NAD(+) diphosphatase [Prevotella sp.]|nr:NAD(+) diphosphatase [Bacteroides sp.]MCM1366040.1 NAD(+) diphosphatase [Prevotella sp.]MCM1436890.1 NAD(+) diphosphatase [Prevotella sp.]
MKVIAVKDCKVAVLTNAGKVRLPMSDEIQPGYTNRFRFRIGDEDYVALDGESTELVDNMQYHGIRELWSAVSEQDYTAAGKGEELVFWDGNTKYCGKCGAEMFRHTEISKKCSNCGMEIFPNVSPAVIVLVRRGEEALLVHAKTFKRPFFGLVAGFVETGESLEECVAREIKEETDLEVCNVRYFGSQAWPFPSQLMIGFTADYKSGNLRFADDELSDGGFFSRDNIPMIPTPPSIARRMIEVWKNSD